MRPAEDGVRYHARDMAVVRGHIANIPIALSSATPSIESEVNARRGCYARLSLPERSRRGASRPRGLRPKSKKDAPARAIPFGKRFRHVQPVGVCIAPPDVCGPQHRRSISGTPGRCTSSVKIILSLCSNWSCGFSYVLKQALLKFTYLVREGKFEM